jgi:hypothetical protein
VLNSPTIRDYTTIVSSNASLPVDAMVKKYGGATWLFAVAMRSGSTRATFTVPAGSDVEVIGEGRRISVSGTNFSDDFTSYDARLYQITNSVSHAMPEASAIHPAVWVYPNPATRSVFVESTATGTRQVSIFRLNGECVAQQDMDGNGGEIDIRAFATGVYLVRVEGAGWLANSVLIKQ